MGVRRYGTPSQHLARDIVPIGAFITSDSTYLNPDWDNINQQPDSAEHNRLYAVADGTVSLHPSYVSTFLLMVDRNGDGQDDFWFQYRHAELLVAPGFVQSGTEIGRIANHSVDPMAGNETHLDFAVIQRPSGQSVDPFSANFFPNTIQDQEELKRQASICAS
ncbi:hypothetical protein [Phototrophicus methaneseepsis]|nr:hypothetical protein [Phototrophicus methaneseepsis]